jgi:hypothetical protein
MDNPVVVKGPIFLPIPNVWEITVALPTYSPKLASRVYSKMPGCIEHDGWWYYKAGMQSSDCTAWYRRAAG